MLPKDCMMLAKSFFILKSTPNWMLQRRLQVLSMLIVLIIVINGCGDTTSKKHVRYEWKTVMKGDWSSHLYDVHFVSETQGWAVGNAVDITPGLDFGEGGESLIVHTSDGGNTWHRQHSGVFGKPLRKVYFRSALEGWSIGEEGVLIHTSDGGKTWQSIKTDTKDNLNDLLLRKP